MSILKKAKKRAFPAPKKPPAFSLPFQGAQPLLQAQVEDPELFHGTFGTVNGIYRIL